MSQRLDPNERRKLAEQARSKQARADALRRNALTIAVAAITVGLVLFVALQERDKTTPTVSAFGPSAANAGCGDVESPEELEAEHIADGSDYDDYNSMPPTSGPHWQTPATSSFFSDPQSLSQVVHNLEHGQIVLYYEGLDEEQTTQLEAYVTASQGSVLAQPAPDGVEGQLVMTAWTQLQSCESLSSAAIDSFRRRFQGKAPEQLTPPFDG